jgi:hypothetical protein
MAQGPWRCSQCGTINEPVANSCRTCGKWPSLFDLEDSVVEEAEWEEAAEEAPPAVATYDPPPVEIQTFEPPPPSVPIPDHMEPEPQPVEDVADGEERPKHRWTSAILPIALLLYFVISAILER